MSSRGSEAQPARGRHPSLRRQLLWLMFAAIAIGSAVQAVTAYRTALRTADALFDHYLQQIARSVSGGLPFGGEAETYEFSVQAWTPDGVLVFRSRGVQLPSQPVIGFSDMVAGGTRYRVYQLRTPQRTVQVAQDLDAREQRARTLALQALLPAALVGAVLMAVLWLLVARSLRPVEAMRRQVAARPAEDLSPLPEAGLPQEVLPLVRELNGMLRRVAEAFALQQGFVADAAHELRSPLSALKLQAQALGADRPPAEREAALARLQAGIDRAIALVAQLLALARAEAAGGSAHAPVALQALCREVVADLLPQARRKQIDLGLAGEGDATVRGDAEQLRILLRNLLDNAVKYTPDGGRVDIGIAEEPGGVVLSVQDSGPGIAPEEREHVFDRFHRAGATEVPGSGLGLAIVRAIAQRHGAVVRLDRSAGLGGLEVRLSFPAPATAGLSDV